MRSLIRRTMSWKQFIILGFALMFYACSESKTVTDNSLEAIPAPNSFHKEVTEYLAEEAIPEINFDIAEAYKEEYLSAREALRLRTMLKGTSTQIEVEIYPTGLFPDDVINVQGVVDDAGENGIDLKVILKATNENGVPTSFNFDGGWVRIRGEYFDYNQSGNVIIEGETENGSQTTVVKGLDTRLFGLPNDYKAFNVLDRGDVSFENLKFEEGGIWNFGGPLVGPDNMLVENCIFLDYSHFAGVLDNRGAQNSYIIKNNRFENAWRAFAMYNPNIELIVEDNYFRSEQILFNKVVGEVEFKDNTIDAVLLSNFSPYANGLDLIQNFDASFIVKDNHITNYSSPTGTGILIGPNSEETEIYLADNVIDIQSNFYGGIDMIGFFFGTPIKNVCITGNEFRGNAAWAISASNDIAFPPFSEISSITISENDLDNFERSCNGISPETGQAVGCADIFLNASTTNITVCAENAVVVDLGVGNTISADDDACQGCGGNE